MNLTKARPRYVQEQKDYFIIVSEKPEYEIPKKHLRTYADIVSWTRQIAEKKWSNHSMIYQFINIAEKYIQGEDYSYLL